MEDEVVAVDVPIVEDGAFEASLPTPSTPQTDTVGVKGTKVFIDTPFTVGENVSDTESSGDSSVFLVEGVGTDEIGVFAEKNETAVLNRIRIVVVGTTNYNIIVDSSDPTHTKFPCGVLDNPCPSSIPFNHIIDKDNVRTYGVYFNESGIYTLTVINTGTSNSDSVDIFVEEAKVTLDMVSNCTIGDHLCIKGTANAGDTVDIAIDDVIEPWLNDLVIKENGEFSRWILADYYSAECHKIAAYIDRTFGYGTIDPSEEADGNVTVLLTNPTLSTFLTKNVVTQGNEFRIWGIAPGAKSVDILTIFPREGNGTGLEGNIPLFPDTNVTGITFRCSSVSESNHGFLKMMYVDENADSGTYAIIVTTSGANGTYNGVNYWDLLDGIINTYCDGNPEVLETMTQKELVELIKNATINASDSDDLLQGLHLSVAERAAIFDTGAPANPYPSISGIHNGTITPFNDLNVSEIYTYPCPGTGGHTEYAMIWNKTIRECAVAEWNGYLHWRLPQYII
jgi:hypothetical protein